MKTQSLVSALPNNLQLERCPRCGIAKPHIWRAGGNQTEWDSKTKNVASFFVCTSCNMPLSYWIREGIPEPEILPNITEVDSELPIRARELLIQAINSISAPAASVMCSGMAIHAMFQGLGIDYKYLNECINKAEEQKFITSEMAAWAHEARLDANALRHPEPSEPLPSEARARELIEFARTLSHILFVVPAMVKKGRAYTLASKATNT